MSLKPFMRVVVFTVMAGCVFGLSGCTPMASGMVVFEDGNYRLGAVPGCEMTFSEVIVWYLPLDVDVNVNWKQEDMQEAWSVTFKPGSNIKSVTLFEPALRVIHNGGLL